METKTAENKLLIYLKDYILFRNNSGMAWQGEVLKLPGRVVIHKPRPVTFGVGPDSKSGADFLGWHRETGKFTALEIKNEKDRLSGKRWNEQYNFLKNVAIKGISFLAKIKNQKISIYQLIDGKWYLQRIIK